MNNIDKQYQALLQDILDNGVEKKDRTGTGTISVFGRQIRHKMSEGFPLLTTKKMPWKSIVTELLWFLQGNTNIKWLVDNGCNIWNGDAYKKYSDSQPAFADGFSYRIPIAHSKESFIEAIKTDDEFAKKWGNLGPIYGKQWRKWNSISDDDFDMRMSTYEVDQIANLIKDLKTNPDSRRLMVNGCNIWNGDAYKNYLKKYEQDKTLGIVYYTEPLSYRPYWQEEFINKIKTDDEFAKKWGELGPIYGNQWRKWNGVIKKSISGTKLFSTGFTQIDQIQNLINDLKTNPDSRRLMVNAWNVGELDQMVLPPCHYGFQVYTRELSMEERWKMANLTPNMSEFDYCNKLCDENNVPKRAISLMWNQRSVDTFLGLPFNIASYGLLLEIIAKEVNMVPEELIGNLGDVHLYSNHVKQAIEQIGRKLTFDERTEMLKDKMGIDKYEKELLELVPFGGGMSEFYKYYKIPYETREPYELPRLKFSPCPITGIDMEYQSIAQFQIENYESHPTIKAPLSN